LDGLPDYRDLDSDNDGIYDAIEANDGSIPTGFSLLTGRFGTDNSGGADDDTDNDGLNNNVDGGVTSTLANSDTDSDGINDHLDLDSDNDGIVDNVEAQVTGGSYITPTQGDTNANGVLDVFDGANALTPENTDGVGLPDYLDVDSDGDGVNDNIEAFDADQNGFADWDTDGDNDITDEIGYNVDVDGDGIWLIYDNVNGLGSIANLTGSNNARQDTDEDASEDWRDIDDDGDGINTSLEDINSNANFADDFTQGGGTTPNYLYNPDVDGDGVLDNVDFDSDNDGILNADEVAGGLLNPLDDQDNDGIFNYLDSDLSGFTDTNNDGVDDRYDQDRDGIANIFDLDSDNDGIADILEAGLTDSNNDGLVDSFVDTDSNGYSDPLTLNSSVSAGASSNISGTNYGDDATRMVGLPDNSSTRFNTQSDGTSSDDLATLSLGGSIPAGTVIAISMFNAIYHQRRL